ncbi:SpoIIE family protein phosphatase [Geomesophilobacter sediminis]|uniref:SpoIIE family protein phosphatase n=1 Tax=Geomesophilobacter sediminis TaxID=2798584 RepID=A0A8J7M2L4_9BACT|nr:SpoIIE family protein phosphatase [Geomesophilobacter sediminis]MBJ6727483.1 SpoIIE family protein phosphatase [Geomesophilobacter sediminis]
MLSVDLVWGTALLYVALLFLVAYYATVRQREGRSITRGAGIYSLSIAVYATSWTFYGGVGKAATTGLDFLPIYLGPTLTAFSWWFLLRKMVRISKENNITSIADFISSRYGRSQWLGGLITLITVIGIMPYIALQLRAVSTSFTIITGYRDFHVGLMDQILLPLPHPGLYSALLLGVFAMLFGARHLISAERHEGLLAAIAVESVVKLAALITVGFFVTYGIFDGVGDIFTRLQQKDPLLLHRLTTLGSDGTNYGTMFTMLTLSMCAIMLLPRQFQVMVLENADENHVNSASWQFPAYLFAINFFVMPIALGGLLYTGKSAGSDYFVLTIPLEAGHPWLALVAFLGGLSASAGMVMVESVAVATMVLNHVVTPIVIRFKPRSFFPALLINLKRGGIFMVVLLGYFYQSTVGESFMLANMGLISFSAASLFAPALLGGLYWPRGNKIGAITGLTLGFAVWFYTLLLPSLVHAGWWESEILLYGPFHLTFLKPNALFGLSGLDPLTHTLFWSMFLNLTAYLGLSIVFGQSEKEKEQVERFVRVFAPTHDQPLHFETKRLSKPVTIMQFVNLMSKFIGETPAHAAIADYLGEKEIDSQGGVSEFELPNLKRFVEKTLAASLGGAAAGAVVESYLSDLGSKMESVYDIFSTVRTSRDQSREALFVRLRASEIMNRSLELDIIMDDLLALLLREFKLDLCVIRLLNDDGVLKVRAYKGETATRITTEDRLLEIDTHVGEAFLGKRSEIVNDASFITKPTSREILDREGIKSFAHIPIASEGIPPVGILSVFSRSLVGLFTEQFVELLESLAGQLAQAVRIVAERDARERERRQKEEALLQNARVTRELELAKQIQLSLLPEAPPDVPGVRLACRCVPATHVGGDYYDFFPASSGALDLVIADVSGHSVGAALIMVETRSVLRAQVQSGKTKSPADTLALLNQFLYDDLNRAELFITMFCCHYHPETRILSYANAGHTRPILFRKGRMQELDAEGLILGIEHEVVFEEKRMTLEPGDLVFIYTDGIIEAEEKSGELFGIPRLSALLSGMVDREPQEIVDRVLSEVNAFSGGPLQDDVSMIVMKVAKSG